ncbi:hypothetical protein JAAARDRAFT_200877 [Jaapia argillacea MUCL 33604]|uniref:Uncharacterized protein n=1 Tax=Jaapia argillacea MUCL 33604 TaxID=933084 RepID=A0A067P3P8_9AGAM|nr:hypothetical protein JAAARDRAFT_200877 [Jaapia argillacea MUCL 33604]
MAHPSNPVGLPVNWNDMFDNGIVAPTYCQLTQYQIATSWSASPDDEENQAGILDVPLDDLQELDLYNSRGMREELLFPGGEP